MLSTPHPSNTRAATGDAGGWAGLTCPQLDEHAGGATQLKGDVFLCKGERWLKVKESQQAGGSSFTDVSQDNKWMGFDGGPHNGGQWLHDDLKQLPPK